MRRWVTESAKLKARLSAGILCDHYLTKDIVLKDVVHIRIVSRRLGIVRQELCEQGAILVVDLLSLFFPREVQLPSPKSLSFLEEDGLHVLVSLAINQHDR